MDLAYSKVCIDCMMAAGVHRFEYQIHRDQAEARAFTLDTLGMKQLPLGHTTKQRSVITANLQGSTPYGRNRPVRTSPAQLEAYQ